MRLHYSSISTVREYVLLIIERIVFSFPFFFSLQKKKEIVALRADSMLEMPHLFLFVDFRAPVLREEKSEKDGAAINARLCKGALCCYIPYNHCVWNKKRNPTSVYVCVCVSESG